LSRTHARLNPTSLRSRRNYHQLGLRFARAGNGEPLGAEFRFGAQPRCEGKIGHVQASNGHPAASPLASLAAHSDRSGRAHWKQRRFPLAPELVALEQGNAFPAEEQGPCPALPAQRAPLQAQAKGRQATGHSVRGKKQEGGLSPFRSALQPHPRGERRAGAWRGIAEIEHEGNEATALRQQLCTA
jgi:hypothetical protein